MYFSHIPKTAGSLEWPKGKLTFLHSEANHIAFIFISSMQTLTFFFFTSCKHSCGFQEKKEGEGAGERRVIPNTNRRRMCWSAGIVQLQERPAGGSIVPNTEYQTVILAYA